MHALKARVENGRIIVNEPTDLPDGTELYLVLADAGDELDDDERAALHSELEASIAEAEGGQLIDADEVLTELRATHELQ